LAAGGAKRIEHTNIVAPDFKGRKNAEYRIQNSEFRIELLATDSDELKARLLF
jgi:hypothetical protein